MHVSRSATRGLPMPLWRGLRTQVVHADDVADAVYTVLTNWATGAFNLVGEPVLGAEELARIIGSSPGWHSPVRSPALPRPRQGETRMASGPRRRRG